MKIQEKFDLAGRTALVTGGGGLLGSEFSKALAEAGASVAIAEIAEAAGRTVSSALAKDGHRVQSFVCDVTDPSSVGDLITGILKEFGRLDILVNCAALDPKFDADAVKKGITPGSFEDYPLDQWNAALKVNLTGMFLVTQAGVKPMLDRGGRGSIINICSTYGLNGPDQRIYVKDGKRVAYKPAYYTVTKAGVLGFTRYLAAYYAGTEIRVNALTPGGVFNDHEEYFVRNYSARTILGRMARPDEMSGALIFLASDASSYMTGANLVVDGGWTAW
jgi:NAD(P)-dependent dehydrogenase (short-subunit alcohol dehydrogenase family)